MRKEFTMTEDQLSELLQASRPTPIMYLSGGIPMGPSQQENANQAWQKLGEELGFVWDTVEPVSEKDQRVFTAEVLSKGEAS